MTIEIWTVQLARWRLVRQLGLALLDITVKSGVKAFAPDWEFLMAYKRGEIDQAEYTRLYLERMEESKRRFPKTWEGLATHPKVALACYCQAGAFCHRLLFRDLMEQHLKDQGLDVTLQGELTPDAARKM